MFCRSMRLSNTYRINTQRRHNNKRDNVLREFAHYLGVALHLLCLKESFMLRMISHKQACVVSNKVITDFKITSRCLNSGFPSDAVYYQPSRTAFVSTPNCLKRKALEKLVDMWVLFVPFPPLLLAR